MVRTSNADYVGTPIFDFGVPYFIIQDNANQLMKCECHHCNPGCFKVIEMMIEVGFFLFFFWSIQAHSEQIYKLESAIKELQSQVQK